MNRLNSGQTVKHAMRLEVSGFHASGRKSLPVKHGRHWQLYGRKALQGKATKEWTIQRTIAKANQGPLDLFYHPLT